MKIKRKIYFLLFLILSCLFLLISLNLRETEIKKYKDDLEKSSVELNGNNKGTKNKNIMIIAHPDDEVLWGGAHLLEDDYLVVCVTCGTVKERVEEFKKVMEITGDEYMMLGYPDIVDGQISDWKYVYDSIEHTLVEILSENDYDKVVTHNPDGDYGHIHHIMLSKMITKNANKDKLYYFGKYYRKHQKIPENAPTIDDKLYYIKVNKLIEQYPSQSYIKDVHNQMFKYENWLNYYDWYSIES